MENSGVAFPVRPDSFYGECPICRKASAVEDKLIDPSSLRTVSIALPGTPRISTVRFSIGRSRPGE
jgi:hypothetical protein